MALDLLHKSPKRFDRVALIATGDGLIGYAPHTFADIVPTLALVLERKDYPRDLPEHWATYGNFVAATNGDRTALVAMSKAGYPPLPVEEAASIGTPVLVVSGEKDPVIGRAPRLADALGNGQYLEVAGADHFSLAVDLSTSEKVARYLRATEA